MCEPDAEPGAGSRIQRGPVKIMLRDTALPAIEELQARIEKAHGADIPVAIHCVTRGEIVLAVAALRAAGAQAGDRIEHASVAPPDVAALLEELSLCVVTQPNFIFERGDAYARDVEAADLPWLYRAQGLLDAGIALGGGTDAPFGDLDPWAAMRAAVERRSRSGRVLGGDEALSPERALALFLSPPSAPGRSPSTLAVGARADLCLLDLPWNRVREDLSSEHVRMTWVGGERIHSRNAARCRVSSPHEPGDHR
jgi:predicted amidohydrolase YtcJ